VKARLYWDGGHCVDDNPERLVAWIGDVTSLSGASNARLAAQRQVERKEWHEEHIVP
jgi:hypothetical protein